MGRCGCGGVHALSVGGGRRVGRGNGTAAMESSYADEKSIEQQCLENTCNQKKVEKYLNSMRIRHAW